MNCATSTIKYLLFFFNFLVFLCGILLLVPGIAALIVLSDKSYFLDAIVNVPAIIVTVVGAILLVVGFFGCCGAIKENRCMTNTYTAFVIILALIEIAVAIAAFVLVNKVGEILDENIQKAVSYHGKNEPATVAIDAVQVTLECCGGNGYRDYRNSTLPTSCCSVSEECTDSSDDLYERGCLFLLTDLASFVINIVGGVAIGVAVVEVVVIIFSCCLSSSIKKQNKARRKQAF